MNLNKSEVLKTVIKLSLHWESEGVVNVGWIAGAMDSTPYYVRKRVKSLVDEGYIEKAIRSGGWCEDSYEPYPPLKGYKLTDKAIQTGLYAELQNKQDEMYRNYARA